MGNTPVCSALVKVVSPALVSSSHSVLLPVDAHKRILTQQDFIPVSQDGLQILKETELVSGLLSHCCHDVSKLHLAY